MLRGWMPVPPGWAGRPEEGSGWHAALAFPGQQAFFPEEAEDRRCEGSNREMASEEVALDLASVTPKQAPAQDEGPRQVGRKRGPARVDDVSREEAPRLSLCARHAAIWPLGVNPPPRPRDPVVHEGIPGARAPGRCSLGRRAREARSARGLLTRRGAQDPAPQVPAAGREAAPLAARARGPSALAAAAPLPRFANAAERAAALRFSPGAANKLVSPAFPPRLPTCSQSEAAPL
ncbi:unnamed protein product [Rangifer tarandus platyrhynchus]|uniref:Uncharacterized protein n=2 Tax=Rangifer tarandus platyrhynchus TaxID=3082113 RepID=A0ACB0E7H5_RANTA|nr:unnamed protein product [Rangifer tarandus platyrhynchus]CAI9696600.1 unnamed protein product [Rangifer tarandus platyrhynchus]